MLRKIALAVVAVVALLGGLQWVRQRDRGAARDLRAGQRLPFFDERAVTGFVLAGSSTPWHIVRAPPGWRIASPVDDLADPRAVEALIDAARRSPIESSIDDPEAPTSYGLAPPFARLSFEGVETPALEIGRVAPTGEAVFARLAGRASVLLLRLPDSGPLADADPAALRHRSIVDIAQSEIVGIEIAPGALELAREPDGWWIVSPRRFPASSQRVDKLLGAWCAAKVAGWDDTGSPLDSKYGLGESAPRITLRAKETTRAMTLGGDAGNGRRFVICDGRKTILLAEAATPALDPPEFGDLRATPLTNVNRYTVTSLVYAAGAARFEATRKGERTWTKDTGETIPESDVYALLVGLLEAQTTGWHDGKPSEAPRATLDYVGQNGSAGRLVFFDDRASWDALPGVVFRLASPPPRVPGR